MQSRARVSKHTFTMSVFSSNDEYFCIPFALHNKTNTIRGQIETNRLEPESEYGNVEYKLRLTDPTPERVERLVTQLKWRIREGHGEAILFLGVKDNGLFVGLTPDEVKLSLQTLERMSAKIGAKMTVVNEKIVEADQNQDESNHDNQVVRGKTIKKCASSSKHLKENSFVQRTTNNSEMGSENKTKKPSSSSKGQKKQPIRKVLQVLVKRKTHDISEELRVAVLGPTESGKSSLLGVLSHGEYDNGRGSARLNLFRHRHEIKSGHTSSISQEIFGFNDHGQPLTYSTCTGQEEIIEKSSKVVTLIDLAGHQRYVSTTLLGLGSHSPDVVLLVVSAKSTITNVTTDHISLALGIEKSLAIVINKIDLANKEEQENCYNDIVRAIHMLHPDIKPIKMSGIDDAISAGLRLNESKAIPIFFTSCVTGAGLCSLYEFFNAILPTFDQDLSYAVSQSSELQVDETFEVPGIGTVVSGLMIEGIIREGDELLLGPDDQGKFSNVSVVSLQRHKIPCTYARAGQKCTMAIIANNIKVRRGMVMKEMDQNWDQSFSICLQLKAKIKFITNKRNKMGCGSQVSVYVGNVKQTCSILSINQTANEFWLVDLQLTKRPEYIREGSRIIIRHSSTRGIGTVCQVNQLPSSLLSKDS